MLVAQLLVPLGEESIILYSFWEIDLFLLPRKGHRRTRVAHKRITTYQGKSSVGARWIFALGLDGKSTEPMSLKNVALLEKD